MVRSSLFVALVATAQAAFGAGNLPRNEGSIVPGAYIIEFDGDVKHDTVSIMKAASVDDANTRMDFDYKLFKGVSVQFDDVKNADDKAARIARLPAVKQIWPVQVYSIPKPKVEWIGSPETEFSVSKKKRAVNDTDTDVFSPHVMTQVDKLRAKGITGKGIKIAVVDTGIDYKHPALGGCFGPGCLVTFGTDLAGDAYNGFNTPRPDEDPMDCQGHGTHVAGIIAAQPNSFGFTGAAPDVTLGAYRVFGCQGEAGNDVLIAAFNQAFEDGANIITASIGGPSGWSEDPWAVAVSRIVEQGVPCTISAGNSGDQGLFYASTAANGEGVTAIASFDNTNSLALLTVSHFVVNGKSTEFGYTPAEPAAWGGVKLPLWTPDSSNANGCSEYPANTPDLSGSIVLAHRGSCTFVQKATNAAKAGAKYLMLYNNVPGAGSFNVVEVAGIKAAGMVTPEQGQEWISLLSNGTTVTLDMADPKGAAVSLLQITNKATGGALSDFTSWGPTWEMDVKPQFGAPGGSILSTYPTGLGSYAVLSGTSMACPLAAAIVALIGQVRGTFDPTLIENLMSAHAHPQLFNDKTAFYDFLAPVPQQGGGLVQAYDAAYATTLLSPSSMSFNDTEHLVESRNFTLQNTGSQDITYEISHVPAITMNTLVANSIYPDVFVNEPTTNHATLHFSDSKLTLRAGESATIEVLPTPPQGLSAERLPIWSGYVAINGTDGTSLSIPYQGLTGSLNSHVVLGAEDTYIAKSTDKVAVAVPANTTFTLPPRGTSPSSQTLPDLTWGLALGSRLLRADIIPLLTGRGNGTCSTNHTVPVFEGRSIGQPSTFPLSWNPRGTNHLPWTGQLADGSYAPAGLYKVRFSALRIFGEEEDKEDWDVSETKSFGIQYGS